MNPSYIDTYLSVLAKRDSDQWQCGRYPEQDCWYIRYTGSRPPCIVHIELSPALIYFHASLGPMRIWSDCRLAVYRYVLRLNEEISGAKFGLSHDGRISLMVEWPRDGLTFAAFETALRTLLTSYETYYPDIQLVAQNVTLARHLTERELREKAEEDEIAIEVQQAPDAIRT